MAVCREAEEVGLTMRDDGDVRIAWRSGSFVHLHHGC